MAATIQKHGVAVRFMLNAYCPACQHAVEALVLFSTPSCATDRYHATSLSPSVRFRDEYERFLWLHAACGKVLVVVEWIFMG
jgi:hypothetical protein